MNIIGKAFWSVVAGYNYFAEPKAPPPATIDENGIIHASNYYQAARLRDGMTPAGARYKTLTNVGPNKWKAGTKDFDV